MNGINLDSQDGRQAALDVAATARDALPPDGRYDNYEVIFEREGAGESGGSVSGRWESRFTAAQLSAERR
jgi:hypothetical protein